MIGNAWPVVPLKSILSLRKEFVQIDDLATYKRPRVRLHAQGIVQRDVVAGAQIKTKKQQVCRAGEFLVAEIDAKVGGFGVVPESLEGAIVSSHYFLFTVDGQKLDRRFLDIYCRTPAFREQVAARGSTNYAAIRPTQVLDYTMPLPPIEEQRRIVSRVEVLAVKIDEARGLRGQARALAEAVLGGELDCVFLGMIGGAPVTTIAQAGGFVTSGPRGWGDFYNEDGDRRLIRVENVQDRAMDLRAAAKVAIPSDAGDVKRSQVEGGDVLVTITGAIGRVGVVREFDLPCHVSQHVALVRPPSSILSDYLYWYLRCPALGRSQTEGGMYGATKPGLNLTQLRALRVATPPIAEQRRIITYLDGLQVKMDVLKHLQAETGSEIDALLPSILDRAFKGEL